MTLREELEDRADKLDAELLDLSGRIKEIERQSNELHTCLNALDIAEMDAEDAALEPAPIVNTDEGWELEPAPEPQPEAVTDEWHEDFLQLTDEPDDEATRAAAIELTADVEPEIQALIESGEHSYDEVAAIAYPEPEWNEPQTEGYAPVVDNAEAQILIDAGYSDYLTLVP